MRLRSTSFSVCMDGLYLIDNHATFFRFSLRECGGGYLRASRDIKVYLTPRPALHTTSDKPSQYKIHNPYASLKNKTRPESSVTHRTATTWTTPTYVPNTASSVKAMVRNPYLKSPHDRLITSSSIDLACGVSNNMDVILLHRCRELCVAISCSFASIRLLLTVISKICYIYNEHRLQNIWTSTVVYKKGRPHTRM